MSSCGLGSQAIRALRVSCRELAKRNEPNHFLRKQMLARFRRDMYLKDPEQIKMRNAIAVETAEYLQSLSEYNERLIYNRVGADHESQDHLRNVAAHVGLQMPEDPFAKETPGQ